MGIQISSFHIFFVPKWQLYVLMLKYILSGHPTQLFGQCGLKHMSTTIFLSIDFILDFEKLSEFMFLMGIQTCSLRLSFVPHWEICVQMLNYLLHGYHTELLGQCGLKQMSTIEKSVINQGLAELCKFTAHFILVVELRNLSSNLLLYRPSSRRARARFWLWIMKVTGPTKTLHILNAEVVLITEWGAVYLYLWEI